MAAVEIAPITEVPVPVVDKHAVDVKTEEKAEETTLPFDPVKLKEKYIEERDRRLNRGHDQGVEQYRVIDGSLSHYLQDPWIESGFERQPVTENVDVVIVGGGYGAQVVAVRLIQAGVENVRIIEKAGDFGGTWYWNRYPGAQCDIESYIYMPLLEELGYMPTEKYARAKELLHHSHLIGKKFDLYRRALFQTEVTKMRWVEKDVQWITSTSRGDAIRSKFVVPAAGPLHRPKLPGLEGIQTFKGHSFHSSRWDFDYTGGDPAGGLSKLKDKRVGIIGTGATAVQIVPHLGEWAKQVYVFQRTPSSIDVRGNKATDPEWASSLKEGWQKQRMDNFDIIVNGGEQDEDMVADGWTDILRELLARPKSAAVLDPVEAAAQRQMADFKKMEQVRARADSVVQDKETANSLKPWYNQFCKRPCFHDEYLQTFNRPNVKLVDTKGQGVERITERGVVANGQEFEIDCLIYATGFELANEWTHKTGIEIYGRNGQSLTSKWKDGSSTLHGWASRGFPNCLWVSIVQAALTPNFMHVTGDQAKHFAYIISECQKRGIRTIEPTEEAEAEWTKTIVEGTAIRAEFFKECTPGYYNNEGKPSMSAARNATYSGGSPAFLKILQEWREKNDLSGLEIEFLPGDKLAQTSDTVAAKPNEEVSQTFTAGKSLVEQYRDLQAKHQAEVNDLLKKHKEEVERFLQGNKE